MTEWQDIKTAPRDGRRVRIKDDAGEVYGLVFKEPHWWDAGKGQIRIADGHLYDGDRNICRAVEWQEMRG